jgi:diguanylate cyclase (GGDEF)-like protein/PAS domain S-box-containing protein
LVDDTTSGKLLEALNGIVATTRTSSTERVARLLELGCRAFELSLGLLVEIDNGDVPTIVAVHPPTGAGTLHDACATWFQAALDVSEPISLGDLPVAHTHPIPAAGLLLRVPLEGDRRIVVCFASQESSPRRYDSATIRFLKHLAQWLGVELDRRQQQDALQRLTEWQRVILQGANLSIIATDLDGIVINFNHAAEKMLGYAAEEMIGKLTPAVFHDPAEVVARAPELSRELGQLIEPGFEVFVAKTRLGIAEEREWTYVRKDGSRLPVLLSVTALHNAAGAIQGYLGIAIDLTLRKQFEDTAAQARANALSRALIRSLAEGVVGIDTAPPYCIHFINPAAENLFGIAEADAIGKPLHAVVEITPSTGDGGQAGHGTLAGLLRGQDEREAVEATVCATATGRVFPVDCAVSPVQEAAGRRLAVMSFHDISERKQVEQMLRLSDKVFEYSAEAIMVTDRNGIIMNVNPAFTWLTGYRPDEAIGRKPSILKSDRHDKDFYAALWQTLIKDGRWSGEIWDRRKDGSLYPKWVTINAIREDGDISHFVALFYDISERKENEERINFIARHDHLTGLPNRLMLKDQMARALAQADRSGGRLALIFIDLDRFKNINDSLGHHVGDQLLIEVSRRLVACVRVTDIVARLGGDEFVVVVEHIDDQNDAAQVAVKIHATLGEPVVIDGKSLHTPPSIGISLYPDDGRDVDTLMKQADTAMYKVKSAGRNDWMFYTPRMNDEVQERLGLEGDLHLALARGEFLLHYQPQWDASGTRLFGWEALLRWCHPERGLIPPDKFIPIAEETGLILPLGEWVLATACAEIRRWEDAGLGRYNIGVNLSARQFRQQALGERIEATLAATGLAPDRLELEITESVLMEDADAATAILRKLKRRGVRMAIDDFGTGYSSLAYLKAFPIDKLKIDRSFVRDIATDPNDAAIVSAIISMARSMGLTTIAEGVESEKQQAFLLEKGCAEIQGYLLGKPMPGDEAMALLGARRA